MSKRECSSTTNYGLESSELQTLGSPNSYMTLEEQLTEILMQAIIMEREVSFPDFEEIKFEDLSIGDIMDDHGWIGFFKRTGSGSVDLVLEFNVTLLDVVDIDAPI
ncbi:hypothetical protein CJ030_MR2G013171 [Morella rubra]|uniref:Uncharacterized protein n=1 Tax=Morella rubra TaxID=262757 RepID=A0A6A1WBV0_9ROSI|nr:hypothetical protein CJ030_MR2G013171 [Morella rubra]